MKMNFSTLCTPAKLYFAIAVIAAIVALFSGAGILAIFMNLVFAGVWTYILSFLCKAGYQSLSWFLVLLPYIFILLAILGIMKLTYSQRNMLNSIKLQGPFGQENFASKKKMVVRH
jgi:hypothetical protein